MTQLCTKTQALVADALGLASSEITAQTGLATTAQWDSLAHMRIVLGVEESLGRQLGPDEIVSIMTAEDVAVLLAA